MVAVAGGMRAEASGVNAVLAGGHERERWAEWLADARCPKGRRGVFLNDEAFWETVWTGSPIDLARILASRYQTVK